MSSSISLRSIALAILATGVCTGCSHEDTVQVEAAGIVEGASPLVARAPMDIFGLRMRSREIGPSEFAYDLPSTWEALPASGMRKFDLRFAGGEGQCYMIQLPGGGGPLADNVNRWRNQCGYPPIDGDAVARLPRRRLAELGVEATVVDLRGSYTGMGGATIPGQRFIGLIWHQGDSGYYLVCLGKESVVDAAYADFESFVASVRAKSGSSMSPHGGSSAPSERADPSAMIDYDVPTGWKRGADRPMRILNFDVGGDGVTTCYLAQAGGSTLDNVNRWRGQLGASPLDASGMSSLAVTTVFGQEAKVVEAKGDFAGGMGVEAIQGAMLLGAIAERGGTSLFIKMLGKEATVTAHREAFFAFCKSLRPKDAGNEGK
ncbi:MAG: hypothetical protein KDC95_07885 [Planctomycetes bacterium]|nr:hypothetical protein [Planctomycetota bacterium]